MLRISATTLESFRLYMDPAIEWMTEDDLLATIRGEFVPTHDVSRGLAFGLVLAKPDAYRVAGGYQVRVNHEVFTFDSVTMHGPLAALDHRRGCFELKAEKRYSVGVEALVVSKADYIIGAHLREFKTTDSAPNFDKYERSVQWRLMADAFEPELVTYDVFQLDDHENGVVELRDTFSFNLYPYPALHDDCRRIVGEFCDYVRLKGLEGLLERRQQKAEAMA